MPTSNIVWKGPKELRAFLRPIDGLRTDPRNARRHNKKNLHSICESLSAFGQQKPTVIKPDGSHVAGSGTFEAAKLLGWTHLAAIPFNGSDEEAIRYGIADNRTGELAEWDTKVLAELLRDVDAASRNNVPGWTGEDITELLKGITLPPHLVNTVEELANMRDNTVLRQIVLVMQATEYEPVLDELEKAQEELGYDTNADVILHLLRDYARTKDRDLPLHTLKPATPAE